MRFAELLLCFQVSKNGLTNSVFTLYELTSGDDTENEGNVVLCSGGGFQSTLDLSA